MAAFLTASSTTVFGNVRTTNPGPINTQSIPLTKVQHFSPATLSNTSATLTAYQLMDGAISAAPGAGVTYTMPTAQNLLAAYSGSKNRVSVGDVMRVAVLNTGTGVMTFSAGSSTGAGGSFIAGTGITVPPYGAESQLNINWTAVSADGTTGVYLMF